MLFSMLVQGVGTRTVARGVSVVVVAASVALACGSDEKKGGDSGSGGSAGAGATGGSGGSAGAASAVEGTSASFDVNASFESSDTFFDFPYPSDARLTPEGTPNASAFPNPSSVGTLQSLINILDERPGFPAIPNAYFRFDAPLPALVLRDVIAANTSSSILLVDIDPDSPDRGKLFPTAAKVTNPDPYVPENLLGISPVPGVVLPADRSYAFVVMRSLEDAAGEPLGSSLEFEQVKQGQAPEGERGAELVELYAPLWETLEQIGVNKAAVAAATVFTVGDVVQQTADLSDQVVQDYDVQLRLLQVDPDDGADHDRYCEIIGEARMPQFQTGAPPFAQVGEGLFELDSNGKLIQQREEDIQVVISFPKQPMPAGGYPLVMYFHGSGGIASQVVDRGVQLVAGGGNIKGEGPAHVLAEHGLGSVGSSHPMSPERVPGASAIAYLSFDNLAATRDIFRQGILEQRLFLEALLKLEVDPSVVEACTGMSLPAGETAYKFADNRVMAMGQSMGGMYTNLIGAVEPKIEAVVPTGAGGYWSFFIEETAVVGNLSFLAGIILSTPESLDYMHPAMHMFQTAWEAAEPLVHVPRLAMRPLEGHPARPTFEPVGLDDSYFSTNIYDAFALAYGHEQVGDEVWNTMQPKLQLAGRDGFLDYPVSQNRSSASGDSYTGVVAQYAPDDVSMDGHYIYVQREEVRYQYGCFLSTFSQTGAATLPAPAPLGTPCPGL